MRENTTLFGYVRALVDLILVVHSRSEASHWSAFDADHFPARELIQNSEAHDAHSFAQLRGPPPTYNTSPVT
jgi:hypothetical protein